MLGASAQRALCSLLVTALTSLVLYLANSAISSVLGGAVQALTRRGSALTTHEHRISQNIVASHEIKERLDDIGGLCAVKDAIRSQVLLPLKYPRIFFGSVGALHPPRGVLLYGPPGTGKTMLARAVAAEAGCPFVSLTLSTLEDKFFGESSKLLSATFSLARKIQPCVLFFDEIDGMLRKRSDQDQACVYGFKTEFLTHLDGIGTRGTDAVVVIGCTNCADGLDQAVKRRLSQQYHVNLPTREEMVEILSLQLRKESGEFRREHLSRVVSLLRPGLSASDLSDIVRSAWSTKLAKHTSDPAFLTWLDSSKTSADDVYERVGSLTIHDLVVAIVSTGQQAFDVLPTKKNEQDSEAVD